MVTAITNGKQVESYYHQRIQRLVRAAGLAHKFPFILHTIRKKKLEELIYRKSPYPNLTRNLIQSETILGDAVYNTAKYASIRVSMMGDYVISPGLSKEANWPEEALKEALAEIRIIELSMRYCDIY